MSLTIATWNINSVRLRSGLVQKLLTEERPDILCLQETKCPNDSFPLADFRKLGYQHIAMNGQKGYHGVAILSRLPFTSSQSHDFADKSDCRHISITLGKEARKAAGFTIHNFYVPAGGDIPDPEQNEKFDHKLRYLEDMIRWGSDHQPASGPAILTGDLNIAPLECEKLGAVMASADWVDAVRHLKPEPERVYTWWSYRSAEWAESNRGRRLDHIWTSKQLAANIESLRIIRDARSWERPSDHVPVIIRLAL